MAKGRTNPAHGTARPRPRARRTTRPVEPSECEKTLACRDGGTQVPGNRMRLEEVHPLALTGARLVSDRLEFRYLLEGPRPESPGRITAARLIGPGLDLPLDAPAPGVLTAPLPEAAGGLSLQVDQAEGYRDGAPPLPWRVDVRLEPEALAEYLSAEPLDAVADLPGGVRVAVRRVLRRRDEVVVFSGRPAFPAGRGALAGMRAVRPAHVLHRPGAAPTSGRIPGRRTLRPGRPLPPHRRWKAGWADTPGGSRARSGPRAPSAAGRCAWSGSWIPSRRPESCGVTPGGSTSLPVRSRAASTPSRW